MLLFGKHRREISGGEVLTTNNRMELTAVISGLHCLKEPCEVDVYSDSAYVVNAFVQGWVDAWSRNGWKKSDKKPVLNADLWGELLSLCGRHTLHFHKVKGQTVDIIKLNGSVELGPLVGLSEVIVDIVESGKTLQENGLTVLENIVCRTERRWMRA